MFRFLELLGFPMTDYCQFTFTFRFKNYSEVTQLAYFILHIVLYIYLYVFNNGKRAGAEMTRRLVKQNLGQMEIELSSLQVKLGFILKKHELACYKDEMS